MEGLLAFPIGYCIGYMYIKCRNQSRNEIICNVNRQTNFRRNINKRVIPLIFSSKKSIEILDISLKKRDEEKMLENQFIKDYPNLTLDERKELADNITEIKYFDEIEKIENDYDEKIKMVCCKIDEFYDNELKIKMINKDYYISPKREEQFMKKIKDVMLMDDIEELNNLYCKEQLEILNDIKKKNTNKSYEEDDNDNYMI